MSLIPAIPKNLNADISNLIKSNSAFTNPLANTLALGQSSIASMRTLVSSIGFSPIPPLPANPLYNPLIGSHANDIISAIDTLTSTFNRMILHTNNLSGVNLSTGLNGANFATLAVIASNVQNSNGTGICELVNGVFGSILNAASIVNQINTLIGQIQNILSFPDQIANNLNFIKQLLESQIANDLLAFANAELTVLQNAVATALGSLLNDACIGNIISQIGTIELKQVLGAKVQSVIKTF